MSVSTGRHAPSANRLLEVVSSAAPEAPHRGCGPPTKSLTDQMRRKVPRLPTDEDRATAERQRKAAWARTQRQAGQLRETAETCGSGNAAGGHGWASSEVSR